MLQRPKGDTFYINTIVILMGLWGEQPWDRREEGEIDRAKEEGAGGGGGGWDTCDGLSLK